MNTNFLYPKDLAIFVHKKLRKLNKKTPPSETLNRIFEIAFFASLNKEEGESIISTMIYIDMANPDPNPPLRIVSDRWNYTTFEAPILLTINSLIKISKSFPPSSGALAICKNKSGELVIWGAIDQYGRKGQYQTREIDVGAEPPGILEVSITGVGLLEISRGYQMLATYRHGRISFGFSDVLEKFGPIKSALKPAVLNLVSEVKLATSKKTFNKRGHWIESIYGDWNRTLSRILLQIQNYGHGGALLITPDLNNNGLSIKYPLKYSRLRGALIRHFVSIIFNRDIDDTIDQEYLHLGLDDLPVSLHLDEAVTRYRYKEAESEITGSIKFISALSRVDGLILMNNNLEVRGYGVIINTNINPTSVWLAGDSKGTTKKLKKIDPKQFGTRHQSMMKICFQHPGSIGFVISQDGDIRAMMRVKNKIIVWEDIKLRHSH